MILGQKGPHGVGVTSKNARVPLPQRSKCSTLKPEIHFIPNSTTAAACANPLSPVNMISTSQTTSSNRHTQTTQPKTVKSVACAYQKQATDNSPYVHCKAGTTAHTGKTQHPVWEPYGDKTMHHPQRPETWQPKPPQQCPHLTMEYIIHTGHVNTN